MLAQAVNPPLVRTSTVVFETLEAYQQAQRGTVFDAPRYGRSGTATTFELQRAMAALAGAQTCLATSCGLSALTAVLGAHVGPGRHILLSEGIYGPTRSFCEKDLATTGTLIEFFAHGADVSALLRDTTSLDRTRAAACGQCRPAEPLKIGASRNGMARHLPRRPLRTDPWAPASMNPVSPLPAQPFPSLPPLHTLRAFEAAARLGSFAQAAEEISLTQSAVSHQIRALEAFFGFALFTRERQRVVLTPAGDKLLPAVLQALTQLQNAVAQLKPGRQTLRVSVLPSFANRWLVKRLGAFMQAHPEVDLHIGATQDLVDLRADGVQLAIRYGLGQWPGLHALKLADEAVFPVAGRGLVERLGSAQPGVLFRQAALLRDDWHHWPPHLPAHLPDGLSPAQLRYGPLYGDSAHLLEATEQGQGIALGRDFLVRDALATGALVRVGEAELPGLGAYYLVSTQPLEQLGAGAAAFARWLRQAMG